MPTIRRIKSKKIKCENPKLIGSGANGIVVKCGTTDDKSYIIKFGTRTQNESNPEDQNDTICAVDNETIKGEILSFMPKRPKIFTNEFGKNNILKYYNKTELDFTNNIEINNFISSLTNDDDTEIKQDEKEIIANTLRKTNANYGCYLTTEFCDQGDLPSFLYKNPNYITDYKLFKGMVYQILSGLIYLYNKNIYHWDFKPSNILVKTEISSDNQKKIVFKLGDFGTALDNKDIENKINSLINNANPRLSISQNKPDQDDSKLNISFFDENLFSGTKYYIPDVPFRLCGFYRDIYAFVISLVEILQNKYNSKFDNDDQLGNPNIQNELLYETNDRTHKYSTQYNISIKELIAPNPPENSYQPNINNFFTQLLNNTKSEYPELYKQSVLVYKIAGILEQTAELIKSSIKPIYLKDLIKKKTSVRECYIPYMTSDKDYAELSKIYNKMFLNISELFKTRIAKTLKQQSRPIVLSKLKYFNKPIIQKISNQTGLSDEIEYINELPVFNIQTLIKQPKLVFLDSSVII